jgi:hypothetical protein
VAAGGAVRQKDLILFCRAPAEFSKVIHIRDEPDPMVVNLITVLFAQARLQMWQVESLVHGSLYSL